ncbi:BglG family transcription antiterminator [Paenibacillus monticola]|uniref:PRD domain-containing protein n=1 Tax=Paenibacillus monticola TaxID=2666075 RepID=A0A7X2H328_9BACL|nr:PRD domain-containing protein [Paenibacillus monticola]MRN52624.1 PRD domain-containing protein [Paenibacillus monticola]
MNERQRKVLLRCIKPEVGPVTAAVIAGELKVSEKTIRNDLKIIDEWLSTNSFGEIVRKPNQGIFAIISESQRQDIEAALNDPSTGLSEATSRWLANLKLLLLDSCKVTVDKLSDRSYTNKNIIYEDLETLQKHLGSYGLKLESSRKDGYQIKGEEERIREFFLNSIIELQARWIPGTILEELFLDSDAQKARHIVRVAERSLGVEFSGEALHYLNYTILLTISRVKLNHVLTVTKAVPVPAHDAVALELAAEIEQLFALRLPETEKNYLAWMVGGAKRHVNFSNFGATNPSEQAQHMGAHLISLVSLRTGLPFSRDSELEKGLVFHFEASLSRLAGGVSYPNPLLKEIKRSYYYIFDIVAEVVHKDELLVSYLFTDDEISYAALHFQAAFERISRHDGAGNRILIVCSMGVGISMLLKTKICRKFTSLTVVDVISEENLRRADKDSLKDIDFVISVIPLKGAPLPVIVVSPLFMEEDEERVESFIDRHMHRRSYPLIASLLHPGRLLLDLVIDHPFEAMMDLAGLLEQEGTVKSDYAETVIIREMRSPTTVGGGLLLPHGETSLILCSSAAFARLKAPIFWGQSEIEWVLLLAYIPASREEHQELFHEITDFIEDKELLESLRTATPEKTMTLLAGEKRG